METSIKTENKPSKGHKIGKSLFIIAYPILVFLFIHYTFHVKSVNDKYTSDIDSLKSHICKFDEIIQHNDSLLMKAELFRLDFYGSIIRVGINTELKGLNAIIFSDEEFDFLRMNKYYRLTNFRDPYKISVKVYIVNIEERKGVRTDANMFISRELAERLNIPINNVTTLHIL